MNWKSVLYDHYVSSGQVIDNASSSANQFRSRAPFIRHLIRRHIPRNREIRILDVGCGHGAFLYFLQQAGYRNGSGVDSSEEQVMLAKRLDIGNVEIGNAIGFLQRQPDASASVVLLFDILEHLDRQELFEVLEEVGRVLNPEGRCIGHVPNASGILGMNVRYGDLTHELAFTERSLQQVFRSLGFSVIQCYEDKPTLHSVISTIRRIIWEIGTIPIRILLAAETGQMDSILSRNLTFVATRGR